MIGQIASSGRLARLVANVLALFRARNLSGCARLSGVLSL